MKISRRCNEETNSITTSGKSSFGVIKICCFFFKILDTTTPNVDEHHEHSLLSNWKIMLEEGILFCFLWCHWEIVRYDKTVIQPTGIYCFLKGWQTYPNILIPPTSTILKILILSEGASLFRKQNIWKFKFSNQFQIIVRVGANHIDAMCLMSMRLFLINSYCHLWILLLWLCCCCCCCFVRSGCIVHQYCSIGSYTAISILVHAESSRLF